MRLLMRSAEDVLLVCEKQGTKSKERAVEKKNCCVVCSPKRSEERRVKSEQQQGLSFSQQEQQWQDAQEDHQRFQQQQQQERQQQLGLPLSQLEQQGQQFFQELCANSSITKSKIGTTNEFLTTRNSNTAFSFGSLLQ
ncbi:conserved hypothetical protein [Ricinus communis]|uniref:Uncharacterized protein n=1 Tax=Ricinus communis TaxID=3988 RepID=B9SK54_RICCO|nr:conserved hypothetical protein [Ricinus communis]